MGRVGKRGKLVSASSIASGLDMGEVIEMLWPSHP